LGKDGQQNFQRMQMLGRLEQPALALRFAALALLPLQKLQHLLELGITGR
jgi:hypothetical protein